MMVIPKATRITQKGWIPSEEFSLNFGHTVQVLADTHDSFIRRDTHQRKCPVRSYLFLQIKRKPTYSAPPKRLLLATFFLPVPHHLVDYFDFGDFLLRGLIKTGYIIVGEQTVKIESHNNIKIMSTRSMIVSIGNVAVELIHKLIKLNVAFVPRPFNAPPILLAIGSIEFRQRNRLCGFLLQLLYKLFTFKFQSLVDELTAEPFVFL